jgi:predicted Rossmann fold nucleotide-binding protein DprA/Smf involved in DNA uptake
MSNSLETIKDLQARKQKALEEFESNIKKEVEKLGIAFSKELAKAAETYKILAGLNPNVWSDPQYEQALQEMSLAPSSGRVTLKPAKARRTRITVEEGALLKFIGKGEITPKEVESHFGCSYITAASKLKELEKAKKVSRRKVGVKVFYKAK